MPRAAFLDGHGGILTDNRLPLDYEVSGPPLDRP